MINSGLKNTDSEHLFESRRLDVLFKQTNLSGYLGLAVAIIITNLADQLLLGSAMSYWLLIQAIIIVSRTLVVIKIKKLRRQGSRQYYFFHSLFISMLLVSGISWGCGVYLFMPGIENIELMVVFITVMTGMAAVSIVGLIVSVWSCHAFIIPSLTGVALRFLELEYYSSFYSLIVYMVFLTAVIFRLNKTISNAICLDIENETLIKQVTIEKNIAEQANKEKSNFLAAASHDMRQPLNSLSLFHFALRESLKNISDEKPLLILNRAEQSYQAINNLFDSLLEISSLDAGTVKAENKNIKLQFIIQPIIDEMSEVAHKKNLELHYQPSLCNVETDPVLLSRILRNLISNAIKYSHEGTIDVIEEVINDHVSIKIQDMGIGIPDTEYKNIFNEYHQLANKKRGRRQGIGLGLSIVKRMCDVIAADITVISTVDIGSTFTVTLETIDGHDDITDITDIEIVDLSGKKALVLDDEPDILMAMELLFNIWNMDVKIAENFVQGKAIMADFQPDIIICDYRIQNKMNGVEVIEALRNECKLNIPAIVITGDTDPSLLKLINSQGFEMLSKPIQPSVLHQEIALRLK